MTSKKLLVFVLVLLILIIIYFNIFNIELPGGHSSKYPFHLDSLGVEFSGLSQEGITAVTSLNRTEKDFGGEENLEFKEYFQNDLNNIANELTSIDNITISSWLATVDVSDIQITYNKEFGDDEKLVILNIMINKLNKKWYIKQVQYSNRISPAGE